MVKSITSVMVKLISGLLLFSVLCMSSAFAAKASVWATPAVVAVDELVTLTITLNSTDLATPDFSGLENDFKILSRNNTSKVIDKKGSMLIEKKWVLVLLPLIKGTVTIPAIRIGADKTTPINIQVNDKPVANLALVTETDVESKPDLFIEAEVDQQEAYVQGQIILTQKIFHAIPLENGKLSPPKVKNNAAEIIPLSHTEPYTWKLGNKDYHVIERSYALFPKQSRSLQIEATEFTGTIVNPKSNANQQGQEHQRSFSTKVPTATYQVQTAQGAAVAIAPTITIAVKPQAKTFNSATWLPAKNITLYANWSKPIHQLQAGEAVTLQLGIIADGLRAEQLPDIKFELPEGGAGAKSYFDKVELNNTITVTGVTGVWSQKITLVPSQNTQNKIHIPEFKLPWWNTTTDRKEIATLKEHVLHFGANEDKIEQQKSLNLKDVSKTSPAISDNNSQGQNENVNEAKTFAWIQWMIVLSLLILAAYFLLMYRRKWSEKHTEYSGVVPAVSHAKQTQNTEKDQQIMDSLKLACLENNPKDVEELLPKWAEHIAGINPPTLSGIAKVEEGYLRLEIEVLSRSLYGRLPSHWKGDSLWETITRYPYKDSAANTAYFENLQAMYPSSRSS